MTDFNIRKHEKEKLRAVSTALSSDKYLFFLFFEEISDFRKELFFC
jgi:hypothetical protein